MAGTIYRINIDDSWATYPLSGHGGSLYTWKLNDTNKTEKKRTLGTNVT